MPIHVTMHIHYHAYSLLCIFIIMHIHFYAYSLLCIFISMHIHYHAYSFLCIFISIHIHHHAYSHRSLYISYYISYGQGTQKRCTHREPTRLKVYTTLLSRLYYNYRVSDCLKDSTLTINSMIVESCVVVITRYD